MNIWGLCSSRPWFLQLPTEGHHQGWMSQWVPPSVSWAQDRHIFALGCHSPVSWPEGFIASCSIVLYLLAPYGSTGKRSSDNSVVVTALCLSELKPLLGGMSPTQPSSKTDPDFIDSDVRGTGSMEYVLGNWEWSWDEPLFGFLTLVFLFQMHRTPTSQVSFLSRPSHLSCTLMKLFQTSNIPLGKKFPGDKVHARTRPSYFHELSGVLRSSHLDVPCQMSPSQSSFARVTYCS